MPYTRVMHNPLSRAIFQLWLGDVQQEICEMNSKCSQCRHTGALLLALMTRSIQFNVKFSFVGKDLFLVAVESALLWVGIARFSPFFAIRFFASRVEKNCVPLRIFYLLLDIKTQRIIQWMSDRQNGQRQKKFFFFLLKVDDVQSGRLTTEWNISLCVYVNWIGIFSRCALCQSVYCLSFIDFNNFHRFLRLAFTCVCVCVRAHVRRFYVFKFMAFKWPVLPISKKAINNSTVCKVRVQDRENERERDSNLNKNL